MNHEKKKFFFGTILVFLGAFITLTEVFSQVQADTGMSKYVSGEVLVKVFGSDNIFRIRFDNADALDAILQEYRKRPDVEIVEPNYYVRISAFPNDPEYEKQWYLQPIRAREAWSRELIFYESGKLKKTPVIAVLDTGVDIDHPDLQKNIWVNIDEVSGDRRDNDRNGFIDDRFGWDFVADMNDPRPKLSSGYNTAAVNHGTVIAGIAAAIGHNAQGISGVSWHARIMPLRVLDSTGSGTIADIYRAVRYAVDNGADVINMSFVGEEESAILSESIRYAYDHGVIVVAASGNLDKSRSGIDFQEKKMYPVCSLFQSEKNYVIGVASVDRNLQRSKFTNFGNDCIDISAPGEYFYSTLYYNPQAADFRDFYGGYFSGSSVAAPLVSATFALVKSVRPDEDIETVIDIVLSSVTNIPNSEDLGLGKGLLNVDYAFQRAITFQSEKHQLEKQNLIIAGLGYGSFPQLKIFQENGKVFKTFYAYSPTFQGAVRIAIGDVDGDGKFEIITGAGYGGGPHVRIFNIEGRVLGQFFAFDQSLRNGVNVVAGDINGDGIDEIITGAGPNSPPEVKVFHRRGELLASFLAYHQNFSGGVNVAAGDINGDGIDEIITGAGYGGGPHVRIFNGSGGLLGQFFAFNSSSRGGVRVAAGDLNNDIFDEIITAVERGSSPTVRVFRTTDFKVISEFLAYAPNFFEGFSFVVGDTDGDGDNEIVTGPSFGGTAHIRIFNMSGRVERQFFAHPPFYTGGARVGILPYGDDL